MKAYVITTGAVFGLGPALLKDPFYIVITIAAAALCVWAWRVLRLMRRS